MKLCYRIEFLELSVSHNIPSVGIVLSKLLDSYNILSVVNVLHEHGPSEARGEFVIPRMNTVLASKCFGIRARKNWNGLMPDIKNSKTLENFKRKLNNK